MTNHLLSDEELVELTGYSRPADQQNALARLGITPMIRRDGKLRVTWEAVTLSMTAALQSKEGLGPLPKFNLANRGSQHGQR